MDEAMKNGRAALEHRYGAPVAEIPTGEGSLSWPEVWSQLATRGSCRYFQDRPVSIELIHTLAALALCSPTKSDLQQRDIIIVEDKGLRAQIDRLLSSGPLAQAWIPDAPTLLIFCGNNRRQRQIHEWCDKPFANDHLDAFFNAAVDAGIALAVFVVAAEAAGLGCAPISAIRNDAQGVSELLDLPDHVFPVAGLGIGWPIRPPRVSLRLPLATTVHRDRFSETGIKGVVEAYDRHRHEAQPIQAQRAVEKFGTAEFYGWSEDKARQYTGPERADFGAFVRRKGFRLD